MERLKLVARNRWAVIIILLMIVVVGIGIFLYLWPKQPTPLVDDALPRPVFAQAFNDALGIPEQSAFMTGRVGVITVPPQCTGSGCSETWDPAKLAQVRQQLEQEMRATWQDHAPASANLSLEFVHLAPVLITGVEPIQTTRPTKDVWIKQMMTRVMEDLGIEHNTEANIFAQAMIVNEHHRQQYGWDWVVTIMPVNAEQANGHKFADGTHSFAYIGGPFAVWVVPDNGWPETMSGRVGDHEFGHLFGALDTYAGTSCEQTGGYLRNSPVSFVRDSTKNRNGASNPGCAPHVPNIMDMTGPAPAPSTRYQAGWGDVAFRDPETGQWMPGTDGWLDVFGAGRFDGVVLNKVAGTLAGTATIDQMPVGGGTATVVNSLARVYAVNPVTGQEFVYNSLPQDATGVSFVIHCVPVDAPLNLCLEGKLGGRRCLTVNAGSNPDPEPKIFKTFLPIVLN